MHDEVKLTRAWIHSTDALPEDETPVVGITMHHGEYVPVIASYARFRSGIEGWLIQSPIDFEPTDVYAWYPIPIIPVCF